MDRFLETLSLSSLPGVPPTTVLIGIILAIVLIGAMLHGGGRAKPKPGREGRLPVEDPRLQVETQPVWSPGEGRLREQLQGLLSIAPFATSGHVLLAHIPVADVLTLSGPKRARVAARQSMEDRRFDFLIATRDGFPLVAIEHRGTGGSRSERERDLTVKRAACGKAGLTLVEVVDRDAPDKAMMRVSEALSAADPELGIAPRRLRATR